MARRRGSTTIDEFIPGTTLTRAEQQQLLSQFKKTPQTSSGMVFYDFFNLIKSTFPCTATQAIRNQLLGQISRKEIKILDFNSLIWAANLVKKQSEDTGVSQKVEQNEYYDSFVALGGNPDKTGFVNRNTLMKTIITQFGVEIDIDSTIEGLRGLEQERLNYEQFCDLFKSEVRPRHDSMKSVQVTMEDFNEYLLRAEQDGL